MSTDEICYHCNKTRYCENYIRDAVLLKLPKMTESVDYRIYLTICPESDEEMQPVHQEFITDSTFGLSPSMLGTIVHILVKRAIAWKSDTIVFSKINSSHPRDVVTVDLIPLRTQFVRAGTEAAQSLKRGGKDLKKMFGKMMK